MLITFLTTFAIIYTLFFALRHWVTGLNLKRYHEIGIEAKSTIHILEYVGFLLSFSFLISVYIS